VEIVSEGYRDVLPKGYSAHNTVYEYGGSPYDVLPDGRIIFSNASDNWICLVDPDTQKVTKLAGKSKLRYSNFHANPMSTSVLAVEEDHEFDAPADVKNYVVAIDALSGDVKRVVTGADFYYTPQFSPDGTKLTWLEWDHPDLPFFAAKLYYADWDLEKKAVGKKTLVGGPAREGIAEPRWGPDGSLFFGKEVDGYRRLFQMFPSNREAAAVALPTIDEAEFGQIRWSQGRCVPWLMFIIRCSLEFQVRMR